jgi:hypothetical protein
LVRAALEDYAWERHIHPVPMRILAATSRADADSGVRSRSKKVLLSLAASHDRGPVILPAMEGQGITEKPFNLRYSLVFINRLIGRSIAHRVTQRQLATV